MWLTEVDRTWPGTWQHPAVDTVLADKLRATVEALAYPRDYERQHAANQKARDWLREKLRSFGYDVTFRGRYDNIIATPVKSSAARMVLLGSHYDTVPTTPGADDNNSAIAVCLESARVLALHQVPVQIAIFNREEVGSEGEGLMGSSEYVASMSADERATLIEAHIFEMVGYLTREPNTQSKPAGLPIKLRSTGDFIGVLSNSRSNRIASRLIRTAKSVGTRTPLVFLKIFCGLERRFKDLLRSDHTPFWNAGLPALMWTDTSEFRNPHYHRPSDTPDTLDYASMADVTRIIVGHVIRTMSR